MLRLLACILLALNVSFAPAQFAGVNYRAISPTAPEFTDFFPYTNGELASVSGGNWTTVNGNMQVISHVISNNQTAGYGLYSWSGVGSFNANQFATVTFTALGNDDMGPGVRTSTSGGNQGYGADCAVGACRITKVVNGVQTNLTSFTGILAPGDVIRLEASGTSPTVLTLKKNGAVLQTYTDSTAPITSAGTPGLFGYGGLGSTVSIVTGGNL